MRALLTILVLGFALLGVGQDTWTKHGGIKASLYMTPNIGSLNLVYARYFNKHAVYVAHGPIRSLVYSRGGRATAYNGTQLALALELYRHDHGKYPETLDELVPTFFDVLPADPYSDKPFIYRPADGEYWLYSIGQNFRDDNGHAKRDILIRQPKVEPQPQPQPQPPGARRMQPRSPAARRPSMRRGRPPGRMRGRPRPTR